MIASLLEAHGARPRIGRLVPSVYCGVRDCARTIERTLRFVDRVRLEERHRGSATLVCMLAGYKSDLWHIVMPRFEAALPEDVDVCLLSPGIYRPELSSLCARKGWSYLSTATNDVCLAQNIAYRLHLKATLIMKLDEDMFLLPDTLSILAREYWRIKAAGKVDPGFVAPMIPLNGFCYHPLLERLDLLEEYEARFGVARIACAGTPLQADGNAARWIWERTAPLQRTANRLSAAAGEILLSSVQFSIGLIAFERQFWQAVGYLPVFRRRLLAGMSTLGADEEFLCACAVARSRPGVVTLATLAGHFSFGPQYAAMKALLEARPELFRN